MKRRKVWYLKRAAALSLLASALVLTGKTSAYLISRQEAVNRFLLPEDVIEIEESFTEPEKLTPGQKIMKSPAVKNKGNIPVFVRMRAEFSDSAMESCCEPVTVSEEWSQGTDGYYYYKKILQAGEYTEPLFDQIVIRNDVPEDLLDSFDLIVYSESKDLFGYEGTVEDVSEDGFRKQW